MSLAVILVVAAVVALVVIIRLAFPGSLRISEGSLTQQLQPLDIEAFRNLVDPAQTEYLRGRLPGGEFRKVQRQRLRATALYLQVAGRNAALLIHAGQLALSSSHSETAEAARRLVDDALLLRRNTSLALLRTYLALAWPGAGMGTERMLSGYERLSSSAMLLGRLQRPDVPVRISAR
jgi:hypothetical protein